VINLGHIKRVRRWKMTLNHPMMMTSCFAPKTARHHFRFGALVDSPV
jgi:hypothetical protein